MKKRLFDLRIALYQSPSLSSASPRVAAADQMLKKIILALEDDLDRAFIQPMIHDLRIRLTAEKIRVGILQRESMLATNRGKARVDPNASAQLSVGETQDILAGVQQLAGDGGGRGVRRSHGRVEWSAEAAAGSAPGDLCSDHREQVRSHSDFRSLRPSLALQV